MGTEYYSSCFSHYKQSNELLTMEERNKQVQGFDATRSMISRLAIFYILISGLTIRSSQGWTLQSNDGRSCVGRISRRKFLVGQSSLRMSGIDKYDTTNGICEVKIKDLQDMDVVIYSLAKPNNSEDSGEPQYCLGALQEDGVLSPLSAWTDEPAFGEWIEFLVDEVDRFTLARETENQRQNDAANPTIRIHHLLSEAQVSYGSRQCPRGPHNPHGEESELLYYVEQQLIDHFQIKVNIKPELEMLW